MDSPEINIVLIQNPIILLFSLILLLFFAFKKVGYLLGIYCSSSYLLSSVQLGSFNLLHIMFVFMLTATAIYGFRMRMRLIPILRHGSNLLLLLFFIMLCLSFYMLSEDTLNGWLKLKYFIFFSLIPYLIFHICIGSNQKFNEFITAYIVSCVAVSVITLWTVDIGNLLVIGEGWRLFLMSDPITFSIPFAISSIFLVYYLLEEKCGIKYKVPLSALLSLFILLIILSGTRQCLLPLIPLIPLFVYLRKGRGTPLYVYVMLAGACVLLYFLYDITSPVGLYDRYANIFLSPGRESSVTVRITLWIMALRDFLSSPLVGIGLGSFGEYIYLPGIGYQKEQVHSLSLEILAEEGFIGVALFGLFLCLVFHCATRLLRTGSPNVKPLLVAFLCIFIFSLIQSMLSGALEGSGHVLWSASGLIILSRNHELIRAKSRLKAGNIAAVNIPS
jgi:O-antigen ligase